MDGKSNLQRAEEFAVKRPTCEACQTCALANGEPPFENGALKGYCIAYSRADGRRKPAAVMYDGAPCAYHRKE